jgi:hypothetical protein
LWNTLSNKLLEIMDSCKKEGKDIDLFPSKEEFTSIMELHSVSPDSTELRYTDNPLLGESTMLFLTS